MEGPLPQLELVVHVAFPVQLSLCEVAVDLERFPVVFVGNGAWPVEVAVFDLAAVICLAVVFFLAGKRSKTV